ncbi:hypothetical protein ACFQO7_31210 [Catellatospora aurea]|uniref:ESAT-6 protein secretion system EspG family protein n=1 Tax=Catellatospora aurea TaxID=1337874 RepID=A0ABW2H6Q2_9ACTN
MNDHAQVTMEPDQLDVLALQRRASAEEAAELPRPEFILGVKYSEVVYTFATGSIPFMQADPTRLREDLYARFELTLDKINMAPLLSEMSAEALAALPFDDCLRRLVKADNSVLTFEAGKFPVRHGFVPIRKVKINIESIQVGVEGVSKIAEVVAQEVAERIWAAAGALGEATKRWEDIAPGLALTSYGTSTRVQLPFPFEALLAPGVRDFLAKSVTSGPSYGSCMGPLSQYNMFQPAQNTSVVATLDELDIQVNRFDTTTGYSYDGLLKIGVVARNDFGTGRVLVTSPMQYDRHVECLRALLDSCTDSH